MTTKYYLVSCKYSSEELKDHCFSMVTTEDDFKLYKALENNKNAIFIQQNHLKFVKLCDVTKDEHNRLAELLTCPTQEEVIEDMEIVWSQATSEYRALFTKSNKAGSESNYCLVSCLWEVPISSWVGDAHEREAVAEMIVTEEQLDVMKKFCGRLSRESWEGYTIGVLEPKLKVLGEVTKEDFEKFHEIISDASDVKNRIMSIVEGTIIKLHGEEPAKNWLDGRYCALDQEAGFKDAAKKALEGIVNKIMKDATKNKLKEPDTKKKQSSQSNEANKADAEFHTDEEEFNDESSSDDYNDYGNEDEEFLGAGYDSSDSDKYVYDSKTKNLLRALIHVSDDMRMAEQIRNKNKRKASTLEDYEGYRLAASALVTESSEPVRPMIKSARTNHQAFKPTAQSTTVQLIRPPQNPGPLNRDADSSFYSHNQSNISGQQSSTGGQRRGGIPIFWKGHIISPTPAQLYECQGNFDEFKERVGGREPRPEEIGMPIRIHWKGCVLHPTAYQIMTAKGNLNRLQQYLTKIGRVTYN